MTDLNTQSPLELEVKNFGPIAEAKIDLRPFTVFVGPSNTGKSYLAILIYALHKYFSDDILFGYRSPLLSSFRYRHSLVSDFSMIQSKEVSKEAIDALSEWTERTFPNGSKLPNKGSILLPEPIADLIRPCISDLAKGGDALIDNVLRCFGVDEAKMLIRNKSRRGARVILRRGTQKDSESFVRSLTISTQANVFDTTISEKTPIQIDSSKIDSGLKDLIQRAKELIPADDVLSKNMTIGRLLSTLAANALTCFVTPLYLPAFYLPADRTGIMHAHSVAVSGLIERAASGGLHQAAPTPMLSGVLADFLKQLITLDKQQPLEGLFKRSILGRHQRSSLGDQIEKAILDGTVDIQKSATNYPSFTYRPEGWKNDLPLMNASSMVSELAPVVLYLRHVVRPGNVLIVEEPESHLHPVMQVEFTRQLAALVRAGVRVIITTHSEWVLEELANIVRLSGLSKAGRKGIEGGNVALQPEEVGAWLFQPKNRPRGSVVKEIPLDDDSGLFPSGFDEVAVALHNKWAEISSRGGASG